MEYKINSVPERVIKTRKEWAESDAKRDAGLTEPADIKVFRNISYGPFDEWNLLDVYRPVAEEGKLPVIVNIHGGGYFYGDKELYSLYSLSIIFTYQSCFLIINYYIHFTISCSNKQRINHTAFEKICYNNNHQLLRKGYCHGCLFKSPAGASFLLF